MMKTLPLPGSLSTFISPPLCFTIPKTTESPKPVPLPETLVVKNGSKRCALTSSIIPQPLSRTFTQTIRAPVFKLRGHSPTRVSRVITPLPRRASRAFITRLRKSFSLANKNRNVMVLKTVS